MKKPEMTVYFVPITHHDLGYTHVIDDLFTEYCRYYDRVLDDCDATDCYPEDAKYHYTVEQFWSLDYYVKHTTPKQVERLKRRVKEGRIELPAFYVNIIDCIASDEELIRLTYPSFAFAKECGVKIKRASLTDIPGMSGGIAEVLSEAGVKYLFAGFPKYFNWPDHTGKVLNMEHSYWAEPFGRPAAFNWKSKSGGQVLTWFQNGYGWFGDNDGHWIHINKIDDVLTRLPGYLKELKESGYPYQVMRYIYRGNDNQEPNSLISDIVKEWNEKYSDTGVRLKVATDQMFFEALEKECKNIPSICGEIPHTDYTVLSLTEAEMTARNKVARQKLTVAERLGAVGGTEVFKDLILYDEHCFGMSFPCGSRSDYNRNFKIRYPLSAMASADKLLSLVSNNCVQKENKGKITVFHPAGIKNKGICDFISQQFDQGVWKITNAKTGEITYGQSYAVTDPLLPLWEVSDSYASSMLSGGVRHCLFDFGHAEPVSYNTYEIEKVENFQAVHKSFYRYDPITGELYDQELGRMVTDSNAKYPLGTVLTRDIAGGNVYSATVHSVEKTEDGPLAERYLLKSSTYGAPEIITEITLHRAIKRVDIAVRLSLSRVPAREIFLSIPLAISKPRFRYHGVNYVGDAFDPAMQGVNTNHYTTQNWVKAYNDSYQAVVSTIEGGTVYCGGLHTTEVSQAHHLINPIGFEKPFVKAEDIHDGHIYTLLAYNNCRTNFAMTQQGEVIYRFSLTTGESVDEWQFSEGFVYAPIVLNKDKECSYRHIKALAANVLVQHVKPAEDGRGYIIRLRETVGVETTFALDVQGVGKILANRCSILEEDIAPVQLKEISIAPFGIVCIRCVVE